MKKVASILLILFGVGLTAFGISGFSGELRTDTDPVQRFNGEPGAAQLSGSFGWSPEERLEIVIGVISLSGGLILRKPPLA